MFLAAVVCTFHAVQAGEVKLTPQGLAIHADAAGIHTLSYPRLLTGNDQGLTPENITIKVDGSGATMTYSPSGRLVIDRQADGGWLFHFTEIPPDRVKFCFGIDFPVAVIDEGAMWAFDGEPPKPFSAVKDQVRLHIANPARFVFQEGKAGFAITYPQKTFTTLADQRVWGKKFFSLGHIFYFPGKKTVPEIDYSIKLATLPSP